MHSFIDGHKIQLLNTEDALADANYPASGSYIDMSPFTRGVFLVGMGAMDGTPTMAVYQDKSATQTASIKALSGATVTLAGTDDDTWHAVEFECRKLDGANDFRYVTLTISSTGTDYGAIFFIGIPDEKPVTQGADYNTHVEVAG